MNRQGMVGAVLMPALSLFVFGDGAYAVDTRYTWMLPKTVFDTTLTYTFQECTGAAAKFNIAPTIAARPLPDLNVGQKQLKPELMQSFIQDKSISLQTFASSHIISSIGSQPTDQTAQIGANILGGVAKLVAVGLGTPAVAAAALKRAPSPTPTAPTTLPICASLDDAKSAPAIAKEVKSLKDSITNYERQLSGGVDEATQKKISSAITAAQNLVTELQGKLTFTIKATIDPGVTAVVVDADAESTTYVNTSKSAQIDNSGLVATICPSRKQLSDLDVFSNLDQLFSGKAPCAAVPTLKVSVYLDFPSGHSTMYVPNHEGQYDETDVSDNQMLYRDVAYIPVTIWRGEKTSKPTPAEPDGSSSGDTLLMPPMTLPFGQFGVAQSLPFQAGTFETLNWAITFLEDGEITNATYSSKAWGLNLTSLFGAGASAANSIATEARAAATQAADSAETEAVATQGQADLIYQTERLKICEANPSACTQK